MKRFKLIKPFLGLFLLLILSTSCKKDENTGTLKVTFVHHTYDLSVAVSPAENPEIVISDWLKTDANGYLAFSLNSGNYILRTSPSAFSSVGFQIKVGETTFISFDENNVAHIQ